MRTLAAPSSVRGLAFLPKGYRLAISHYNGASLWFPNAAAAPDELQWKGSHLEITVSPDGRFVVTAMQENALHAWRIADKKDLRLSGYPAKPRSLSWSRRPMARDLGRGSRHHLAFQLEGRPGEQGAARMRRPRRESQLRRLSSKDPRAGARLRRWADPARSPARRRRTSGARQRGPEAAITALAWDDAGRRLLFGGSDGAAGLLTMPA